MSRETVRAPRQARSQATLERLCAATVRLLETRNWPDVTVAEIVAEAGSSIGSFYARFADKEALLDHLDQLYTVDMVTFLDELADQLAEPGQDLASAARRLVDSLIRFHRRRTGLVRALVLRARMYREPTYDERTARMNRSGAAVIQRLAERLPASLGPRRERRAFLGFSFTFSALRDRILFPESVRQPFPLTDDELAEELARNLLAYLGAPQPGTP